MSMADGTCYFCGRHATEAHHIMHGTANRKVSEKYGLVVDLCHECHQGTNGVHGKNGREKDLALKQRAERDFDRVHGERAFLMTFGRSYR